MPRGVNKSDLPEKICLTCGKPYVWRKTWEKIWAEVKYCSDQCRLNRKPISARIPP